MLSWSDHLSWRSWRIARRTSMVGGNTSDISSDDLSSEEEALPLVARHPCDDMCGRWATLKFRKAPRHLCGICLYDECLLFEQESFLEHLRCLSGTRNSRMERALHNVLDVAEMIRMFLKGDRFRHCCVQETCGKCKPVWLLAGWVCPARWKSGLVACRLVLPSDVRAIF